MDAPEFKRGLTELARRDLVFDTLVVPRQLAQLAAVARENPDLQIVVNHLGTPLRDTLEDIAEWTDGMQECAQCENVSVKLSGLWVLDRGWAPQHIGGPVRMVVDLFGADRCMWATNYPVEKLMCPVSDQIHNLEAVLDDLSEDDKDWIFRRTAATIYRIPVRDETIAVEGSQAVAG
jgi:predicted TIM-barrel fold metal-dependent hydrolase